MSKQVRRSVVFAMADSYFGVALQLISSLILVRLMTPSEIGIFAVAAVFATLATYFRDFGIAEYMIQEKDLTSIKIRAAYTANLVLSWSMGALIYFSSTPVAEFYRTPGIAEVMRVQAITFLLIPFGAVTMAFLRRELNYRPIFIVGIAANLTSFVVVIAAALSGLSYMSMAWSSVACVLVTVIAALFFRPQGLPLWPSTRGLKDVIRFGVHACSISLVGQLGRSAPEAVIGRVLDMAAVAFFSRANGLMEIFNRTVLRAILPVCLPYFAKSARDGEPTRLGYLKATVLLTGLGWPFFLFVGAMAYSIIRLLYGAQWMESVPLAQILCLVAIIELPYFLATEVLIAEGHVDQSNRLQIMVQGIRLLSLAPVFAFGLAGACWGLVAGATIGAIVAHRILNRFIGLHFSEMLRACLPSALVGAMSILPVILLLLAIEQTEHNFLLVLPAACILITLAWLASLRLCRHPFWNEISQVIARFRHKADGQ